MTDRQQVRVDNERQSVITLQSHDTRNHGNSTQLRWRQLHDFDLFKIYKKLINTNWKSAEYV